MFLTFYSSKRLDYFIFLGWLFAIILAITSLKKFEEIGKLKKEEFDITKYVIRKKPRRKLNKNKSI